MFYFAVCVCVNDELLSSFLPLQLHLQTELYKAGPVGHWLCNQWWQHTADHPPQQTAVPGPHRWLQGGLVRNPPHTLSVSSSRAVCWWVVLNSPLCSNCIQMRNDQACLNQSHLICIAFMSYGRTECGASWRSNPFLKATS